VFSEDEEMAVLDDVPGASRDSSVFHSLPDGTEMSDEDLVRLAAETGISHTEARQLLATYSTLDIDGSGAIELNEVTPSRSRHYKRHSRLTAWSALAIVQVKLVLNKSSAGLMNDLELNKWMEDADEDGDGVISFPEFLKMYRTTNDGD
jgi:Ca2+-binding EF-hand superfamily protein